MDEKHSKVRWDKVLKNYRDSYNYEEEWEIATLELIANSIDASARIIKIYFNIEDNDHATLVCVDNGRGMNKEEFEEYHNLGSLTKTKSSDTIGFAGIGAKLTLDLCNYVYTETRKEGITLASLWRFDPYDKEPKYKDNIKPHDKLKFSSGTYIEINNLIAPNIDDEKLKYLIYENYQYVLDKIDIYVNDEKLKNPLNIFREAAKKIKRIKNPRRSAVRFTGEIFYLDDEGLDKIKEFYKKVGGSPDAVTNWFDIVVFGKTIIREENFNLELNVPIGEWEYIKGYIRCDDLIEAVTTSKDNINKRRRVWKQFKSITRSIFIRWLNEQGLLKEYEKEEKDKKFKKLVESIEEDLNELLKRNPELLDKIFIPGVRPIKSDKGELQPPKIDEDLESSYETIPIPDSNGYEKGSLEPGGELGRGIHGGSGHSLEPTVPHPGDSEDIESAREEGEGTKISLKRKRMSRYKIGIAWASLGTEDVVIWDSSNNTFIINSDHPAAILSMQDSTSKIFYTIHEILRFIVDTFMELDTEEDKKKKFWELYNTYLEIIS